MTCSLSPHPQFHFTEVLNAAAKKGVLLSSELPVWGFPLLSSQPCVGEALFHADMGERNSSPFPHPTPYSKGTNSPSGGASWEDMGNHPTLPLVATHRPGCHSWISRSLPSALVEWWKSATAMGTRSSAALAEEILYLGHRMETSVPMDTFKSKESLLRATKKGHLEV